MAMLVPGRGYVSFREGNYDHDPIWNHQVGWPISPILGWIFCSEVHHIDDLGFDARDRWDGMKWVAWWVWGLGWLWGAFCVVGLGSWTQISNHPQVDGKYYCWCFRNPKQPPGMYKNPVVNNGISTTNLKWWSPDFWTINSITSWDL